MQALINSPPTACSRASGSSVLNALFIELEKLQLIEVSLGEYPLVTLTAKGAETMRSGANVRLRWPSLHEKQSPLKPAASDIGVAAQELGFDEALFDKMKRLRSALAQSEGKPAYVIFSNATLRIPHAPKAHHHRSREEDSRHRRGQGELVSAGVFEVDSTAWAVAACLTRLTEPNATRPIGCNVPSHPADLEASRPSEKLRSAVTSSPNFRM